MKRRNVLIAQSITIAIGAFGTTCAHDHDDHQHYHKPLSRRSLTGSHDSYGREADPSRRRSEVSFYDLKDCNLDEREEILSTIDDLLQLSHFIDWDTLHNEYVFQQFDYEYYTPVNTFPTQKSVDEKERTHLEILTKARNAIQNESTSSHRHLVGGSLRKRKTMHKNQSRDFNGKGGGKSSKSKSKSSKSKSKGKKSKSDGAGKGKSKGKKSKSGKSGKSDKASKSKSASKGKKKKKKSSKSTDRFTDMPTLSPMNGNGNMTVPTISPTREEDKVPDVPTASPTREEDRVPRTPTNNPTREEDRNPNTPTATPTREEDKNPSTPTLQPTREEDRNPSTPTIRPTPDLSTPAPDIRPTPSPSDPTDTLRPTSDPTVGSTEAPSAFPTTSAPTPQPTVAPTERPLPTSFPSDVPTLADVYRYDDGNCPEAGRFGVPCAEVNLRRVCDKYDPLGSFRVCWESCKPSFCCIHDAKLTNTIAPSCSGDENCAQYAYCYLVWWKFHDTIGPAIHLRLEADDAFYDVRSSEIETNRIGDDFEQQLFFHHFDDIDTVLAEGEDSSGDFSLPKFFNNEDFWDYEGES